MSYNPESTVPSSLPPLPPPLPMVLAPSTPRAPPSPRCLRHPMFPGAHGGNMPTPAHGSTRDEHPHPGVPPGGSAPPRPPVLAARHPPHRARALHTQTSRPPPKGFDAFFACAKERGCLVVWRDFAPFWRVEIGVAAQREKEAGSGGRLEGKGARAGLGRRWNRWRRGVLCFEYPPPSAFDLAFPVFSPFLTHSRGKSNGGHIRGTNYLSFPRFRLMDLAALQENRAKVLFDERITQWHGWHCTGDCDADAIRSAYHITGESVPREEAYQYNYLLDVDENTFSGRYLVLKHFLGAGSARTYRVCTNPYNTNTTKLLCIIPSSCRFMGRAHTCNTAIDAPRSESALPPRGSRGRDGLKVV
ncbi:hypothetical protein B0H13DRAFT_2480154 [Mycena leptocephala]|nr:hypothetical protein B0H13DRAFT_2480154 [Mycena leptocephala]